MEKEVVQLNTSRQHEIRSQNHKGDNMIVGLTMAMMVSGGAFIGGIYQSVRDTDALSHNLSLINNMG